MSQPHPSVSHPPASSPRPALVGLEITAAQLAGLPRGLGDGAPLPVDFILITDSEAALRATGDRADAKAVLVAAASIPLFPGTALVPTVDLGSVEPYAVAREIATLDILTDGRAGLAVTTPRSGIDRPALGILYREDATAAGYAAEAIEVIRKLWNSWDADAVVRDWDTNQFVDADRVHVVDHHGPHLTIRGVSATPRSPQGLSPVFLVVDDAANASDAETDAVVDVIISSAPGIDSDRPADPAAAGRALRLGRVAETAVLPPTEAVPYWRQDGYVVALDTAPADVADLRRRIHAFRERNDAPARPTAHPADRTLTAILEGTTR